MLMKLTRSLTAVSMAAVIISLTLPTGYGSTGGSLLQQSSSSGQKRREPPPFDRPPRSGSSGGSNTSPPPVTDSSSTRQSNPDTDIDRSEEDRSRQQPPELRRPTDSRNPERAEQPRTKPVLRRPGEAQDDSTEADSRSGGGDERMPKSGPPAGDDDVVKLDATLVNIPVVVSDRSGRYVPRLRKEDFLLYEDGVRQEVAFFGDEQVPFNVVLLLDVSPSVQDSIGEIQSAAFEFIRQLRPDDRVMIVSFDRGVNYHTDFTNNRRILEAAISNVRIGSGTSVYDAVYDSVARKLNRVEGRKALILLSDGEDTTSRRATYDDAIDIVTESDVLVYGLRYPGSGIQINQGPGRQIPQIPNIPNLPFPLPFPWPRRRGGHFTDIDQMPRRFTGNSATASSGQWSQRRRYNRDFMEDIASAGGGPVFDAERITDLSRLTSRIAEELRHVYVVSYYPTNSLSNGGYRAIRIRVRDQDSIAVRHRRGYNARDYNSQKGT